MKSIKLLMAMALMLSISTCFAEIKNAKEKRYISMAIVQSVKVPSNRRPM